MPTSLAIFAVAQQLKPYATDREEEHQDQPKVRRGKAVHVLRQAKSLGDVRRVLTTPQPNTGT